MRIIVLPIERCRFLEEINRKRFAVSKEQNMAAYGMYDPL